MRNWRLFPVLALLLLSACAKETDTPEAETPPAVEEQTPEVEMPEKVSEAAEPDETPEPEEAGTPWRSAYVVPERTVSTPESPQPGNLVGDLAAVAGCTPWRIYVYRYGGGTSTLYATTDSEQIAEALDLLNAAPLYETDRTAESGSFCNIRIWMEVEQPDGGTTVSDTLDFAWSDGLAFPPDGARYEAALDFAALDALVAEWMPYQLENPAVIDANVDARNLAYQDGRWAPSYMHCVTDETAWGADAPLLFELAACDGGALSGEFYNPTGEPVSYGDRNILAVCVDGEWYRVPYPPFAVFGMLQTLAPGARTEKDYHMQQEYGDVPDGNYAILIPLDDAEKAYSAAAYIRITDGVPGPVPEE